MHQHALDRYEEHRKRRVEQEKQDKDSWEPGKLRGLRRRGWAWMKQHADLGLAWMNGHACCFPDLGSAELMLVVQACLPACHVFMVWLMAWASGDWQCIPVSAQGTVMQGRAMLAFYFLAAVFMAWSGWDSHTRLKQLGRSKEQIRAKRQAAAKLFGILALALGFVFLLELGLYYGRAETAVSKLQRLHSSDKRQLETCRATLSQDKQAPERKLQDAQKERDTCREDVKEKQKQHDSATAAWSKDKEQLERKLQDAQKERKTCLDDVKEKQKQHDSAAAASAKDKEQLERKLQDAQKGHKTCLDDVKEKQKQHDSAAAASAKDKEQLATDNVTATNSNMNDDTTDAGVTPVNDTIISEVTGVVASSLALGLYYALSAG